MRERKRKREKSMKGKVRWINHKKHYGFIESEDKKDVFIHLSDSGPLQVGDLLEFEISENVRGWKALNVKKRLPDRVNGLRFEE